MLQLKEDNWTTQLTPTGDYSSVITGLSDDLITDDSTVRINIIGMTCQSCVRNIEENISQKAGILNIKVNLSENCGLVHYNKNVISSQDICNYIDDMGFEAQLPLLEGNQEVQNCIVHIEGMTCNSCVRSIEGTKLHQ